MKNKRRQFTEKFKAQVALEAIKEQKTLAQISSANGIHANQVTRWKKEALNGLPGIFSSGNGNGNELKKALELHDELYCQIGKLKVELDWLKKKLP